MWAWPPGIGGDPFPFQSGGPEVSEKKREKPPVGDGMYGPTLRRVDYFMANILNGMLSDGDLVLGRIDPDILLDKAENLAWKAMSRSEEMACKIVEGETGG